MQLLWLELSLDSKNIIRNGKQKVINEPAEPDNTTHNSMLHASGAATGLAQVARAGTAGTGFAGLARRAAAADCKT